MKLFIRMILIGALAYFASLIFPWWIIVIIGFILGWAIPGGTINAFASGFLGVGLLWMGYAWKIDTNNDSVFSSVMLEIIPLGDTMLLIVTVGVIGGLCGGLATMSGSMLRRRNNKPKSSGYYQ